MEKQQPNFNRDNMPDLVECVRKVEIYEPGNVIKLHYRGEESAMYKYSGAIFGISVSRVLQALNNGDVVPYKKETDGK